jgi:hypothetical protein
MKAPKITQPATINALIPKAASHYSPRPFKLTVSKYEVKSRSDRLPDKLKAGIENLWLFHG